MRRNRIWGGVIGLALAVTSTLATPGPAEASPAKFDCASMEDCYQYDEMDQFLDEAWRLVLGFGLDTYQPRLFGVKLRFVAKGESGNSRCDGRYTARSFEYCPPDNTIYIGQDQLWEFYSQVGDAGAVVGLAHEFGHAMQQAHDVPSPDNPNQGVGHENQADCIAGAWFRYAERQGLVEHPDDLRDLTRMLELIGSSEDDPNRDHGTTVERERSLAAGRTGGIASCNQFAPGTPIYSEEEQVEYEQLRVRLTEAKSWHRRSTPAGRRLRPGR